MKSLRTWYWICTGLFAAFMTFSAVPDILKSPEAMQYVAHLGYPAYFVPYIGWAKLLGSVALVVPGFPKLREWAYAGLFFDLISALYSIIVVDGFDLGLLMMIPIMGIGFTSYILNHKLRIGN